MMKVAKVNIYNLTTTTTTTTTSSSTTTTWFKARDIIQSRDKLLNSSVHYSNEF
jgi:hypothetical protein